MKKLAPAFFLIFAVLPLAAGLLYAFLYSVGLVGALAQGFTLDAWSNTLTDSIFWNSIGLSMLISILVVALSTAVALAILMTLRTKLERPGIRFMLHFPLAIPPIVAAFLSFQWLGSSGMIARAVHAAGWIDNPDHFPPIINDVLYIGVGLTMTLTTFPILLLIFINHFKAANLVQISDLAATLGASTAQIRSRVIAPVLLRRAAPSLLLYGVFLFGAYELPLILGRQSPAMISMFINQKFRRFNLNDLPVAYVATVIYAVLVMLMVILFLKNSRTKAFGLSA